MSGRDEAEVSIGVRTHAENLPRDLERIGNQIGAAGDKAGKEFGTRFDGSLSPRMREAAARLGRDLNEKLTIDSGVLRRNENAIRLMGRDGQDVFDRLGNRAFAAAAQMEDSFRRGARAARFELPDAIDRISDRIANRLTPNLGRLNLQWSDLSHNTRQWTLIIGAVASAMVDLSVLSSALGGGLFAVGGALSAAVLGGGAAVAVFSTLFSDITKLPPALQSTAVDAKALGSQLNDLRFVMADAAFRNAPGAFTRLGGTIRALTPDLAGLGGTVGVVFDRFTRGLEEGSAGFTELRGLIRNASKDLPALASASGTWSVALMRGINRANPLVVQLIGYVDELGNRFDRFTRSNGFDAWIRQSSTTFTEFGRLLDAAGRALNNLVTPESAQRTQQFLRDLTGFMPALSGILGVLGDLNIFGLAAQLLNDFGSALMPLLPPLSQLAGELSGVASIVIGSLADGLKAITPLLALLATGAADFLGALPPGSISAITFAIIGLSGALGAVKLLTVASEAASAASALGLFGTAAGVAEGKLAGLAAGLKGFVGKAGLIGLVTAGAMGAIQALGDWSNEIGGWNDTAQRLVATNKSLGQSLKELRPWDNFKGAEMSDALQGLVELQGGFLGLDWPITQAQAKASTLGGVLQKLDESMGKLPVQQIQSQFQAWARETQATDAQLSAVLGRMPGVNDALKNTATQLGYTGSQQDILNLAMGQGAISAAAAQQGLATVGAAASGGALNITAMQTALFNLAQQELISRDAHRGFEAAVDTLSESIAANGATLDITTAAGRANESAIDALVGATAKYSDEVLKQTGSQVEANAVTAEGRQRLIEMLGQLGITGQAADDYANKLGLIPRDVTTTVQANGLSGAISQTGDLKYMLESINGSVYSYQMRGEYIQYGNREITPPTATGGTFAGPQKRLIGEAGPEAVVPLRRPLSQVDPSVRWLSAIAQGMTPRMASGGIGGTPSRTVVFEAGSIVVQGVLDSRDAALEVADAVAERVIS